MIGPIKSMGCSPDLNCTVVQIGFNHCRIIRTGLDEQLDTFQINRIFSIVGFIDFLIEKLGVSFEKSRKYDNGCFGYMVLIIYYLGNDFSISFIQEMLLVLPITTANTLRQTSPQVCFDRLFGLNSSDTIRFI